MGPGPEPRGRDGITQVESGHDILLPDADTWNRIDKAMAPIVTGWNGSDHYVPTFHLSAPEVQQWNLDCIIYSQNSLDIISGMEREHLSEVAKNKLDELEVTLKSAVQLFSCTPVAPAACARTATRHKKKEVPMSIITSHPGLLALEQLPLLAVLLLPVLCALHLQLQHLHLLDLQLLVLNLLSLVNVWLQERN